MFSGCSVIRVSFGPLYIWLVDNARINNITYKNIDVEYDDYNRPPRIQTADGEMYSYEYDAEFACPFAACLIEKHFEYSMVSKEEDMGGICGVRFENINYHSRQKPFFVFAGLNENSLCEDIVFEGLCWNGEPIPRELFFRRAQTNKFCRNIRCNA